MKKIIKNTMSNHLLLARLFFIIGGVFASSQALSNWDENALKQAADKARQEAALLANRRGAIYKALDYADYRQEAIDKMRFNNGGDLVNKVEVYKYLGDRMDAELGIGFYYAAAQESNGQQKNQFLLDAYEQIIHSDYYSRKFAFNQLEKIAGQLTEEQHQNYESLKKWNALFVDSVYVEHDRDQANVCIDFSMTIASEPDQQWRSLVSFEPKALNDGVYQGNRLCYLGEWQTNYKITIDPSIISNNDIALGYIEPQGYQEMVYTGDRDAIVRIGARGQTIVADENAALTVEAANVDAIEVKAWSIPMTNLSQQDITRLLNPAIFRSNYSSNETIKHNARLVYEGEFEPSQKQVNTVVDAQLRLADMGIADGGIYIVQLSSKDDDSVQDKIAFSVAKAGFSAYKTDDGLWAELRDLRDFSPVRKAEVVLYSRDNTVLATTKTDKQGIAKFEQAAVIGENGAAPDHLIYQDDNSLAYLYLDHQGYDLSDKGLDDRASQAEIQSWLWLDRGVYRPNDKLHAMWLLRHNEKAYAERDLWLELRRPDGSVMHEQMVSPDESGAYHFNYEFANTARLGPWQLRLSLGKDADVIDQAVVRVDAIVAQQIETKLRAVSTSQNIKFDLQADWLYGSPAKGLRSDGDWKISARDWSEFAGWQFGRHDEELSKQSINVSAETTNADGHRSLSIERSLIPKSTKPLSLDLTAKVYTEDGQAVSVSEVVDVKREQPYAALNVVNNQLKVMLVNDDGSLVSGNLDWSLYRVHRNGYWYRTNNGYWEYQYSDTKTLKNTDMITTNNSKPTTINLPIDDGLWLVEVSGKDASIAASTMIEFGSWSMSQESASPEALTLSTDKERYNKGDKVKLNIRAPFDGIGSVKLAHGDIFATYEVEFKNHEATLSFKWNGDWSQGVWILASAWHDRAGDEFAQTERAVGLTWLGSEFEQFSLNPSIQAPAEIKPDGKLNVTVEVPQANDGTWVNVAIIDEGLYRLAPPSFSDPLLTFYGKPSWALSLYDIWGEIIRQSDAAVASLRSGADGAIAGPGMADLPNIDTPLITYWSTPQRVVDGKVSVTMDVPRFHGKLRVMALAYNGEHLGSVEGEVIVKEAVVSNLYTPLFASPKDEANARIRLHNTTEQEQTVKVALSATGLDMQSKEEMITLAADEERWIAQSFIVNEADSATITATINDATITQDIDIRPRALSVLRKQYQSLAAGESAIIAMGSAYTVGGLGLDSKEIAKTLRSYPYYCSEQTASSLYSAINGDDTTRATLFNAQARLANLQRNDGGFGLWQGSDNSDLWLTAFIGESLLRAKVSGELTQSRPLTSLLNYLRREVNYDYNDYGGYGYAHYVLAKAGVNMQGAAIRYASRLDKPSFDSDNLETVLALYLYGENERADALWDKLSGEGEYVHYQTVLSELAKRLYRLHELSEYRDVSAEISQTSQALRAELDDNYSTQELVWLHLLADFGDKAMVDINGQQQSVDVLSAYADDKTKITNMGQQPIALTISDLVDGDADTLIEEGYTIKLTYSDFDGSPLVADALPVNQKVLVSVVITRDDEYADRTSEIMFVYPYAAGEQSMQWESNTDSRMPSFSENRDDRHLAAFTMEQGETEIAYELAMRTAREGKWHAPGPSIEDMYRPDLKAQYPTRQLIIGDAASNDANKGIGSAGDADNGITLQSLFSADADEENGDTGMEIIELESVEESIE